MEKATYTADHAGSGQYGICVTCNKPPTPEGHDGCLGTLQGNIMNACCGHGEERMAYIQYWEETEGGERKRIAGQDAVTEQKRLINKRDK